MTVTFLPQLELPSAPIAVASSPECKLFILGEEPLFQEEIQAWIERQPGIERFREIDSMLVAWELMRDLQPNIAITCLELDDSLGWEVIKQLRMDFPSLKILAAVENEARLDIKEVLRCGAQGIFTKDQDLSEFFRALKTLLQGGIYLSKNLTQKVMNLIYLGKRPEWYGNQNLSAPVGSGMHLAGSI